MTAFRVGLVVVMLGALAAPTWAEDEPLAKSWSGTTQELRDDESHLAYYVPFEPAPGVDPATISWRVSRVSSGLVYDAALIPAFTPSLDVSTGRPRLAITVDFKAFTKPGTFAVEIELIGKPAARTDGDDAGVAPPPARQLVVLQLTHPGATLRPPGTWIVWRTRSLFGGGTLTPARVPLGEISRRSRLSPITIAQWETAKHDEAAVSGSLVVTAPKQIGPGEIAWATLALRDDVPIGTTKGQVEIRAPQLAEPVIVQYEVRTRFPGWYVMPIFLLAGLLGWFFRVFLKQREEKVALRVQGEDVLARVDEAKTGHPVVAQRLALDDVHQKLAAALAGGVAADITAQITAAAAAITTAATSRSGFRTDLVTDARAQAEVLGRRWRLPPGLAVAPVQLRFVAAEQQALADRLDEAIAARRTADDAVADLLTAAGQWARRVAAQLTVLEAPNPPVPAALAAEWKAAAPPMRAALDAIPKADPSTPSKADAFLPSVHAAQVATVAAVEQAAAGQRALGAQVADALGTSDDAAPHAAAITRAVALDDAAITTDAERGLPLLAAATRALVAALRDAIVALWKPADLTIIEGHLATGDLVQAVKVARPNAPMGSRQDIAGIDEVPASPSAVAPRALEPRRAGAGPAPAPEAAGGVVLMMSPNQQRAVVARRASDLKVLLWARAARGVLSLAIATAGAYILYGATFVGTAREIGALAAVAFSTEFTIEHALELLGKAAPAA